MRIRPTPRRRPVRPGGFTMVELLTVLAVIGILAGILIPVIGNVRKQAKIQQSRVLFQTIANAIDAYRAEYGRFPIFQELSPTINAATGDVVFRLNGNGGALPIMRKVLTNDVSDTTGVVKKYNPKGKRFLELNDSNLGTDADYPDVSASDPPIVDAFRNRDIVVVINTKDAKQITPSSITQNPVAPPLDDGQPAAPVIGATKLPQQIAIYSLAENDAATGTQTFITNWDYEKFKAPGSL